MDQFVDEAIRFRANNPKDSEKAIGDRSLFLQELARATDDKDRIRDEILNILIAGRDTTASLLSHAIFEISRKPGVWRSLQEEVAQLEGNLPSYQQLRDMKYVKFCIQESEWLFFVLLWRVRSPVHTHNEISPSPSSTSPYEHSSLYQ